ncbi:4Fe-4S binding protein [Gordonibacter massiliensis (ex Traore et al. 2017)]|uniref:4Fe-4S binding protein n=1 Tax=Gordonibacter massiliensis (ex Traore et al. 2017) TaxID=1841863 RepID=UPI001C8C57A2|nr:4Fe-4S binding protein [Gordonibacter massiliensis (ex Traore et al. 2017)]MBX9032824.1 4Fe-4S binding protein [Gordonibacter massiliensis (ex Traore et al. 2017)]
MDGFEERPEATQSPAGAAGDAAETAAALPENRTDISHETLGGDNRAQTGGKAHPFSFKRARALAFAAVVALVAAGLAFRTGTDTPSSFGWDAVAALCPLGALETMLGAREVMLHPLLLLAGMVVVVAVVGKAFCAWMCPAPWLQRLIRPRKKAKTKVDKGAPYETCSCTNADTRRCPTCALDPVGGKRDGVRLDTRHATLLGALGATAVFGFPVFCLVCPIGLTFATFIGLWHLFQFNETSWGLVIFPAILALEVVFLRKWCAKICPVSALVSLIASANRTLRPRVRSEACLRTSGKDCRVCVDACPEQVDPHSPRIPECSKCGACVEACPAGAIDIKLLPKR